MLRFASGRSKVVNLDFNVWDHSMPEIYGIILGMFVKLDLVECLNITTGELLDFIIDVDRGYLATFYHSFYHAADVTAVLYHMLLDMNASQYLSKPDMAALLLAGLCHDIGHPGLNNLFQVNAKTEFVKQHGETSVLEKYSCSLAMDLVTKHALFRNIEKSVEATLPEGTRATEASMRQSMVKSIMATDMSFHYDMLNNLNSLIEFTSTPASTPSNSDAETESESENGNETDSDVPLSPTQQHHKMCSHSSISTTLTDVVNIPTRSTRARFEVHSHRRQSSTSSTNSDCSEGSISSDDSTQTSPSMDSRSPSDLTPELRQNLMNCLLHAADISNAIKPWALCKRWSDLVVQEFFRQGDIEKAQDLPVSPNMDRDQHNQPQISLGFGDFVVQPYFESFCEFLPEASPFLINLASNRAQWQALQTASQQSGDANGSLDATFTPVDDRRSSSPLPPHLGTGRRVSVAAGVLVLDDSRPQRVHRRLRHSTNTEAHQHHMMRRIKRSLSGRSLSSCLHNLHSHPRSLQALGKSIFSQEAIVSVLKREAAQAGKDAVVTSNFPNPNVAAQENQASGSKSNVGASLPKYTENDTLSTRYRRRHGSLQLESHPSIRQEYGDGYITLNDQDRDFGMWDQGNIPPNNTPSTPFEPKLSTTTKVSTSDDKEIDDLPAITLFHSGQSRQPAPHPAQPNSSRSSTPAVMMGGRHGWGQNGLFGTQGERDRSGCGPLDNCGDDVHRSEGAIPTDRVALSIHSADAPGSKGTKASPVMVNESSDGTLGCVVGTTKPSPTAMKAEHTVTISAATESAH
ncbi:hypothetical protein MVEG_01925 [Podila verticillata NRRL 6337]|nr:MAG: hypothetical protein BYD32DRAFT_463093 [Podila humilis]KFH71629.1 hypothetical protein MVEG_01925 [Podila verticillata NRRL 6337]